MIGDRWVARARVRSVAAAGGYGGRGWYEIAGRGKGMEAIAFVQLYAGSGGGCPRRGGYAPSQTENNSLLALINIENGRPHVRNVAPTPPPLTLTLPLQSLLIHSSSLPFALFHIATFFQPYLFAALLPRFVLSLDSLVSLLSFFFYRHHRVIGFEPASHPFAFLSANFFSGANDQLIEPMIFLPSLF